MTSLSHYSSKLASKRRSRALNADGSGAQMQEILDDLIDATQNLDGAWEQVGLVWQDRQGEIFRTESHGRWAPLRSQTVIEKRHEGFSTDPLVRTGTLRNELTQPVPRSSGAGFVVLGPAKGAPIPYAKFHLRGNGVPQRNPVPRLTGPERRRFLEAVRDHFRPEGMQTGRGFKEGQR